MNWKDRTWEVLVLFTIAFVLSAFITAVYDLVCFVEKVIKL